MLQRIQTLYLIIVAILLSVLFFVSFYKVETSIEPVQVITMSVTTITQFQSDTTIPVQPQFQLFSFVLNLILLVLVVLSIFWYKNRLQQNMLVKFCILLDSGLLVLMLLSTDKIRAMISEANVHASYQAGIILPVVCLIFLFLAGRSIMKDENLVRSADRLR